MSDTTGEKFSNSSENNSGKPDSFREPGAVEPPHPPFFVFMKGMKIQKIAYENDPTTADDWQEMRNLAKNLVLQNASEDLEDPRSNAEYLASLERNLKSNKALLLMVTYEIPGFKEYYYYNFRDNEARIINSNVELVRTVKELYKPGELKLKKEDENSFFGIIKRFQELKETQKIYLKKIFETEREKISFMIQHEDGTSSLVKQKIIQMAVDFDGRNQSKKLVAGVTNELHHLLDGYPVEKHEKLSEWFNKLGATDDNSDPVEIIREAITEHETSFNNNLFGKKELFTSPDNLTRIYESIMKDGSIALDIKEKLRKPETVNKVNSITTVKETIEPAKANKYADFNKKVVFRINDILRDGNRCRHCLLMHKVENCPDRMNAGKGIEGILNQRPSNNSRFNSSRGKSGIRGHSKGHNLVKQDINSKKRKLETNDQCKLGGSVDDTYKSKKSHVATDTALAQTSSVGHIVSNISDLNNTAVSSLNSNRLEVRMLVESGISPYPNSFLIK